MRRLIKSTDFWAIFLLVLYFFLNIAYTLDQPIWSPIDEVAHYDYIDHLSDGKWPDPSEYVSDYTASLLLDYNFVWMKPEHFDGSLETAGTINESYEAVQPPVYYLVMTLPNRLLKRYQVAPATQIKVLRAINSVFFFVASIFTLMIFRELSQLTRGKIDQRLGYFFAFLILIIDLPARYSINNGQLSLLLNTLTTYFIIKSIASQKIRHFLIAVTCVGLSLLTKFTNGYMLILLLAIAVPYLKLLHRSKRYIGYAALVGLIVGISYLLLMVGSFDSKLQDHAQAFASWNLSIEDPYLLLQILVNTSLNFDHLRPIHADHDSFAPIFWVILVLLSVNLVVSYFGLWYNQKQLWVPLISGLISIAILITSLMFNHYLPQVTWADFRHFSGYTLFWLVAIFYIPISLIFKSQKGEPVFLFLLMGLLLPFYSFNTHPEIQRQVLQVYAAVNLAQGVSPTDKVVLGQDGWLFYADPNGDDVIADYENRVPLNELELAQWHEHLETKYYWLQDQGIAYAFVIAPNKHTIYDEYLPNHIEKVADQSRYDQLISYMHTHSEVPIIDLRPALLTAKDDHMPLYDKTGHTWNMFGANITQYEIARHLTTAGLNLSPHLYPDTNFTWVNEPGKDLAQMMQAQTRMTELVPHFKGQLMPCERHNLRAPSSYPTGVTRGFATRCPQVELGTTLIFGDTFMHHVEPYLSQYFAETIYIESGLKSPAKFHVMDHFIQQQQPSLIIEQVSERHLKFIPDAESPIQKAYIEQMENREVFAQGETILHVSEVMTATLPLTEPLLIPLNQVEITKNERGFELLALGQDPYLLLPSFEASPNINYLLRIHLLAPQATIAQFFYRSQAETYFSEDRSQTAILNEGDNIRYIRFEGSKIAGGEIRFDPGIHSGLYILKSLEVRALSATSK